MEMFKNIQIVQFSKEFMFKQVALVPCDRGGNVTSGADSIVGIVVNWSEDAITINTEAKVPAMEDGWEDDPSGYEHNYLDKGLYPGDTYMETMDVEIDDVFNLVTVRNQPEKEEFLLVKVIEVGVSDVGDVTLQTKTL